MIQRSTQIYDKPKSDVFETCYKSCQEQLLKYPDVIRTSAWKNGKINFSLRIYYIVERISIKIFLVLAGASSQKATETHVKHYK